MAVIRRLVMPGAPSAPAAAASEPLQVEKEAAEGKAAPRRRSAGKGKFTPRDLYQEVTNGIIEAIENGTAPWMSPWDGKARWPQNGTTGKPYHGINVLMLAEKGMQDPRWCTFKQAKEKGWNVRKGEHGTQIFFYKMHERETGQLDAETQQPEVKRIPMLKCFTVFNFSQIDGAPDYDWSKDRKANVDEETLQICEEIIDATGAEVVHGSRRAAYSPSEDRIYMPDRDSFRSDSLYYAVHMHELGHWTGASNRLDREFGKTRESVEYAREELRAEIASSMLSMQLGLPSNIEGHATYVEHYLKILRDDKREIFRAAKDAEKISRYVLSFHPEFAEEFKEEHREQMAAAVAAGAPEEIFDASDFDFEPEDVMTIGMRP